ncbi:MAG TPA: radical SAM protein [Candidatus Acidoferrales bacterium]|nr:radical SAM protein [Candidatus Acidoferrales bacterium]
MPSTPVMDRLVSRTVERHIPFNVHLDLTYRCNERCVHCYLEHEDHGELTTAEVKGILDQLAAAGTLFLTLSGGEIFLRKDLFELLAYARELHFDLSLKTNALLINTERARRLRELGVRRIQISIYSADPAVHDAITKVRGSLERSIRAIRFLKSQGLQVKIACPLMKQNLTAYRSVLALAEELDVPYIFDLTITPKMDGDMSLLALRNAGRDLLPVLRDPVLNPRVNGGAKPAGATGSAVSSGLEMGLYEGIPCSAGHNSCYISPYGDVYPCVQMPVPTGNLRQQGFEEVWYESPKMQRVRGVRESQLPVCSRCSIRQFCERCPGLAQMEGGDLLGPYERACELAELNARLAGVKNPVSAFHQQQEAELVRGVLPDTGARFGLVQILPTRAS